MENLQVKKKDKIQNDLELLRQNIVKYLKCGEDDVKITEVKFDDKNYSAKICYNYIDWARSSLRKFIYSTCYFDISGEYELKGVFRYEGYFYKYDNLSPFFTIISKEMQGLNTN
jgi:hypothetical protein